MKKTALGEIEAETVGEQSERRRLSGALGTTGFACNHYRIAPGEGLPAGLHAHMDQEELFVVLAGEATFETLDGAVTVGEGEAVRFAPGEFQSGENASNAELVVLALGAPSGTVDIRIPAACPTCECEELRLDFDGKFSFVCPECKTEHSPDDCPACGHSELAMTATDGGHAVAICKRCASLFEQPPLVE